jgi:hypothetical protein
VRSRVDPVGKRLDDTVQECRAIQHLGSIVELDIGELRHAIDRQEHVQLAISQAQLAVIEVDIANRCLCELASLRSFLLAVGQP